MSTSEEKDLALGVLTIPMIVCPGCGTKIPASRRVCVACRDHSEHVYRQRGYMQHSGTPTDAGWKSSAGHHRRSGQTWISEN